MNVVILGSGRTGSLLATSLAGSGHTVVVIDLDDTAAGSLDTEVSGSGQLRVVRGDGTRDSILEEAGVRDADLFTALTGDDNVNGLAALKAKITYRTMTVIAAIRSGDLSSVYESLGVICVNPARLSADNVIANIPQVLQDQASTNTGA
jgi:trk system potassium uptake protein TrkA